MKNRKLHVGVFGTWRGRAHIRAIGILDEAEVTAICDKDPERIEQVRYLCPPDVKICRDYDELLDSGIDVVVLCNYFTDHAACAIRALRAGIAVVSECLAAVTMRECVELVETVEQTGLYYSMAENTPYKGSVLEMQRLYRSGVLGEVIYAEGEYCHPSSPENAGQYTPSANHWRQFLPATYYLSHSIGPLMNITGLMPKRVIGKVAASAAYARRRGRQNGDAAGIMLVEMEGGALFRVSGCAFYGPESHWFRLACEKGGVENVRTHEDTVSLAVNPWDIPEKLGAFGSKSTYEPLPDAIFRRASERGIVIRGHMDADIRTVYNYVRELTEGRAPDMDVYRSAAISAVGILGWRSVLNGSCQYDIPDFRDPYEREQFRSDDLSPWRGEIPYYLYQVE